MSDEECPLCESRPLQTAEMQAMQACAVCAERLGIVPLPLSRRPHVPCARCNHTKFVRVIPREYTEDPNPNYDRQISAPMYLTYPPSVTRGFLKSRADQIDIRHDGVGLLEAYVCRKCGAVEWYCSDAKDIPAHPHLMSEDIDYEGESPYR